MTLLSNLVGIKTAYKGDFDASGGLLPADAEEGNIYKVTVAGTLSGANYGIGDLFLVQGAAAVFLAGAASDIIIKQNQVDVAAAISSAGINTADIATNAGDIGTNASDIGVNAGNIATNVLDISTNANSIVNNGLLIQGNTDDLADHELLTNEHIDWTVAQGGPEIEITNLPESIQNGLVYVGEWNASTNTPTLADGTGTQGNYHRVSVAGTQDLGSGSQTFAVGDRVVHDGTIWSLWASSDEVQSVFGRAGDVIAVAGDYDAVQVDYTPDALIESTQTEIKGALDKLAARDYVTNAAAFSAKKGGKYNCDTTTVAFAVLLPAALGGESIILHDHRSTWDTNSVTVNTSASQVIAGGAIGDPLILNIPGSLVELIWSGGTIGWSVNILN